jgi:hypothetical protein
MDTSNRAGFERGPRRKQRTAEEKHRMVQETFEPKLRRHFRLLELPRLMVRRDRVQRRVHRQCTANREFFDTDNVPSRRALSPSTTISRPVSTNAALPRPAIVCRGAPDRLWAVASL